MIGLDLFSNCQNDMCCRETAVVALGVASIALLLSKVGAGAGAATAKLVGVLLLA